MGGKQQVWSKYQICAGPFAMEYFIEHTFEPAKNCMTFQLDYERLSDFSDTVGYWCARSAHTTHDYTRLSSPGRPCVREGVFALDRGVFAQDRGEFASTRT